MTVAARAIARTLPWAAFAGGAAGALVLVLATRGGAWSVLGLQLGALLLAAALTLTLDDPAANVLAAVPVPLPVRRALAIAPGLAFAVAAWVALLLASGVGSSVAAEVSLQAGGLALAGLGAAAFPGVRAATVASGLVLAFAAVRLALPGGLERPLWCAVALAGATALALLSRD